MNKLNLTTERYFQRNNTNTLCRINNIDDINAALQIVLFDTNTKVAFINFINIMRIMADTSSNNYFFDNALERQGLKRPSTLCLQRYLFYKFAMPETKANDFINWFNSSSKDKEHVNIIYNIVIQEVPFIYKMITVSEKNVKEFLGKIDEVPKELLHKLHIEQEIVKIINIKISQVNVPKYTIEVIKKISINIRNLIKTTSLHTMDRNELSIALFNACCDMDIKTGFVKAASIAYSILENEGKLWEPFRKKELVRDLIVNCASGKHPEDITAETMNLLTKYKNIFKGWLINNGCTKYTAQITIISLFYNLTDSNAITMILKDYGELISNNTIIEKYKQTTEYSIKETLINSIAMALESPSAKMLTRCRENLVLLMINADMQYIIDTVFSDSKNVDFIFNNDAFNNDIIENTNQSILLLLSIYNEWLKIRYPNLYSTIINTLLSIYQNYEWMSNFINLYKNEITNEVWINKFWTAPTEKIVGMLYNAVSIVNDGRDETNKIILPLLRWQSIHAYDDEERDSIAFDAGFNDFSGLLAQQNTAKILQINSIKAFSLIWYLESNRLHDGINNSGKLDKLNKEIACAIGKICYYDNQLINFSSLPIDIITLDEFNPDTKQEWCAICNSTKVNKDGRSTYSLILVDSLHKNLKAGNRKHPILNTPSYSDEDLIIGNKFLEFFEHADNK
jgi:hypothetical protein